MNEIRTKSTSVKFIRRDSSSLFHSLDRSPPARTSNDFTQQFVETIRRYRYHLQHIQRLLNETEQSYNEINETRVLTRERICQIQLATSDRKYLDSLRTRPLALIICSQTYNGKVRFINSLLSQTLLFETASICSNDAVPIIKIRDHPTYHVSLNVSRSSELINPENIHTSVSSNAKSHNDLIFSNFNENGNQTEYVDQQEIPSLEFGQPLELLQDDVQIIMMSSNQKFNMEQIYLQATENVVPIFIYIIDQETLSNKDIDELKIIAHESILFIRIDQFDVASTIVDAPCIKVFRQLCNIGFLSLITTEPSDRMSEENSLFQNDMIDNGLDNLPLFVDYIRKHIDHLTVRAVTILQTSHELCLDLFNDSACDMARDILITPKHLSYAREKEKDLFESLIALTNSNQSEIQKLIFQALNEAQEQLLVEACQLEISNVELTDQLTVKHARDVKSCTNAIQKFILERLNETIVKKLFDSINVLHANYVGTLRRCLLGLEINVDDDESELPASKALQEMLRSAYQVDVTLPTNSTFFQILIDRMKDLFRTFKWSQYPRVDSEFKRSIAVDILNSFSEVKLAKSICAQLNDRLRISHENFENLLAQLEHRHADRLKTTEDKQKLVRKQYTPKLARLVLESTSLKDLIRYGLPKHGREVGRGHYGVVYASNNWANHSLCVVKSIIPSDDCHWNNLALEFHYSRRIPEHPRIVKLIGSVVDYSDRDQTPVLLVMERLQQDLHNALKNRLDFTVRMRIALDVVEGLRYLHGLGLVHRDIKLKNVLLDHFNRAQIADLGFCKSEVMISGSLVGTPIHMAPELISTKYNHTVDVYAFGILFWYICSNDVRLPASFAAVSSKGCLWAEVKNGTRPERLPNFTDECWEIMSTCWHSQPSQRPYLGEVQEKLELILNRTTLT